jgi:cytoskeleton protein RodZ
MSGLPARHRPHPPDWTLFAVSARARHHVHGDQKAGRMLDIGGTLREARTRGGVRLEDAAAATRIRVKYLAALEDERFGALPEDVYARAFLRTYADFLGLNGDLYAAELAARLEASRPPPPPPPPEPRFTFPRLDRRLFVLVGASGVVLLIGLVAWQGGEPQIRMPRDTTAEVAAPTKTIVPKPRAPRRAAPATGRLALAATRGDCWLSVRAGARDGRILYEGTLAEGEQVRVAGRRLWVRIGAPWNLDVTLNGRRLKGLPEDTGNVLVTATGVAPAS